MDALLANSVKTGPPAEIRPAITAPGRLAMPPM